MTRDSIQLYQGKRGSARMVLAAESWAPLPRPVAIRVMGQGSGPGTSGQQQGVRVAAGKPGWNHHCPWASQFQGTTCRAVGEEMAVALGVTESWPCAVHTHQCWLATPIPHEERKGRADSFRPELANHGHV